MHYRLSALLIALLAFVGSAEAQQRSTGPYLTVSPTPSKLSSQGAGFVQQDANGIAFVAQGAPGSGTVTNTAGALALGSMVIGNGGADAKTIGGTIGGAFTTAGPVTFANGSIGVTLQFPANGPFNYVFPPASQNLASLAGAETFTNKIYNGGQLSGTFSGNPVFSGVPSFTGLSPGVQTRCLGLDAGNNLVVLNAGCGSGGGGSPWTLTDGVHTVVSVGQVTVTGGTVGGSSPNATLTIAAGGTVTQNGNLATNQIVTGGTNGTSDIKTNATGLNVLTALSANVSSPGAFTKNNGDVLSGTFTGAPTFSGAVVFSGFPKFTGLSTGTIAAGKNLGLDASNNLVMASVSGGGSSTGSGVDAGTTPQIVTGGATITSETVFIDTGWVSGTLVLPAISGLGPSPAPYCVYDRKQNVDASHTLTIAPNVADSIGGGTAGAALPTFTASGNACCFRVTDAVAGTKNWTQQGGGAVPTSTAGPAGFAKGLDVNGFLYGTLLAGPGISVSGTGNITISNTGNVDGRTAVGDANCGTLTAATGTVGFNVVLTAARSCTLPAASAMTTTQRKICFVDEGNGTAAAINGANTITINRAGSDKIATGTSLVLSLPLASVCLESDLAANWGIVNLNNLGSPVAAGSGGTGLTSSGASGNVLTSTGTTWISAAPAGGITCDTGFTASFGQCVWSQDASASSNLQWTGLTRGDYRMTCRGLIFSSASATFGLRLGEGGGPTYQTDATYRMAGSQVGSDATNPALTAYNGETFTAYLLNNLPATSAAVAINVDLIIHDLQSTTINKNMTMQSNGKNTTHLVGVTASGDYNGHANVAVTALEVLDFQGTPGTITSGRCTLAQVGS